MAFGTDEIVLFIEVSSIQSLLITEILEQKKCVLLTLNLRVSL